MNICWGSWKSIERVIDKMNKNIKLTIDGIEVEVSISEEELAKLTEKEQKNTGYERLSADYRYYTVLNTGAIDFEYECYSNADNDIYNNANYYTDKTLAENNARADKLMRQLRRFAIKNCKEVEWDTMNPHWFIYYDYVQNSIAYDCWYTGKIQGVVYFDTKETLLKAIDTFKDALMWYFTEYRDRV